MRNSVYRWIAWLGLWLLIAANARADAGVDHPALFNSNLSAPLWGIFAMVLVLGLWIVFTRVSARRASAKVVVSRRRPPHP